MVLLACLLPTAPLACLPLLCPDILRCLSGASELVANLLTDKHPPAKTLKALTRQQYASYAALASLAEALIGTWRALARFWPECQLLVDNQLTPMRNNPMARSIPGGWAGGWVCQPCCRLQLGAWCPCAMLLLL